MNERVRDSRTIGSLSIQVDFPAPVGPVIKNTHAALSGTTSNRTFMRPAERVEILKSDSEEAHEKFGLVSKKRHSGIASNEPWFQPFNDLPTQIRPVVGIKSFWPILIRPYQPQI